MTLNRLYFTNTAVRQASEYLDDMNLPRPLLMDLGLINGMAVKTSIKNSIGEAYGLDCNTLSTLMF